MNNTVKRLIKSNAFVIVLLLIHIYFLFRFHFKDGLQLQVFDLMNLLTVLLGFISIYLYGSIIQLVLPAKKVVRIILLLLFIYIYVSFYFYHYRRSMHAEYSLFIDNVRLIFYKESWGVIGANLKFRDYFQITLFLGFLTYLEVKFNLLVSSIKYKNKTLKTLSMLVLLVAVIVYPVKSYDEMTYFLKSAFYYYNGSKNKLDQSFLKTHRPYSKKFIGKKLSRPNVFIIMVESFNANFVLSKGSNGLEYTPFYNELIKENLFYSNFWGNSIQTPKGQFAVLCSVLPSYSGKVFLNYYNNSFNCLPEILKKRGYDTLFFKAYHSLKFDRTGRFAKNIGFDYITGMDSKFVSEQEEKQYKWGWGIADSLFYKKFFSFLDNRRKSNGGKPFFAALTTVSNHMMFDKVPSKLRLMYKKPKSRKEHYANSIRITDEYLKTFFEELKLRDYLKDSIVIITGDHSFPVGEHGNYANDRYSYSENFKTPLVWIETKKKRTGKVLSAFSQIDIAPTLMDRLNLTSNTHFMGTSMFGDPPEYVYMIQPYFGVELVSLKYPLKFVFNMRSRTEKIFNIETDPMERRSILSSLRKSNQYKELKYSLQNIFFNEYLLENNLIE